MKFTFFFVFLFFVYNATARNFYFRHYTNESGLSHNTVYCSLQDHNGFMWFGTKDGLNRFDGHSFKIFQYKPENNSIKSNHILSLCEDKDGLIWIGTNSGLCYYDSKADWFGNIDSLLTSSERIFYVKSDFQHNIWMLSSNGLFRFNKKTNKVKHYPAKDYFSPGNICICDNGNCWITSEEKELYQYDYRSDQFTKYQIVSQEEKKDFSGLTEITDAGQYGILIGTDNMGLKLFNPNNGQASTIFKEDHQGNPVFIRTILRYSDDEYWIGSESGLYIFNIKTNEFRNYRKELNNPYSIGDNAVYTLTKDLEGGVWIGTFFKGVHYLPKEYTPFERIFDKGSPESIRGSAVREITTDQYGNLWIGTEDAGLNKIESKTGKYVHFSPGKNKNEISGSNIHGLLADGNKLWIGYFDKGIDIMDIPTGQVIKRFRAGNNPGDIKSNFVIKIHKTENGTILVGTYSGLYQYNPSTDNFSTIPGLADHEPVHCILEDHKQSLWVGTFSAGVYCRDKNGKTTHYNPIFKNNKSLAFDVVTDIFEDSRNRIWIGSRGGGLYEFDKGTSTFYPFTMEDGLPSNIVYKILEDAIGNLWISTSNGLFCYHPENGAKKRFSMSNGITNNQFNYNSGFKDALGKMYFGTIDGMTAFVPENMKENDFIPPVYITEFQISNDTSRAYNKRLKKSILYMDKITLPYNESSFSIDFAALSYTTPELNQYRYILEGADSRWTYLKTFRKAYYTNIPPGKYIFRLQANNGNGRWMENEKTLEIIIKPPYWRTPLAYALYSLFLCAVLVCIFKLYTQRIKLKNELNSEMMEDLKQKEILTAKIDFFTLIAHEIRTPLTLIKGPLDRIVKQEDHSELIKGNLSIMQQNTNRLLELSNQLLDFRKTEIEGMKLNFIRINVVQLLKETYTRFTPIAQEKELTFNLSLPVEAFEAIVDKECLIKILSNLFSNGLKFAQSIVDVYMEINDKKETFSIFVRNDGNLIPKEMKEKIFMPFFQYKGSHPENSHQKGTGIGLYIARSLAELHQGELTLECDDSQWNTLKVEFPINQKIFIDLKYPDPIREEKDTPVENSFSCIQDDRQVILIVEDEKEMRNFISDELSSDYQVIKSENGKEALAVLERQPVKMIISDINMPVMNGFELCKQIKSNIKFSHIPFILLTATHTIQMQIEGLGLGADAYMGKPFTTDHLLAQISNLLKTRETLMENFSHSPFTISNTIASNKTDEVFLKTLNEIIVSKLSDPDLSVETLAETLGTSTSSLYRKVKGISEMNPNEFIRIIRLKKAAELLLDGDLSIKEVAYLTGFSAPSYFSSSFSKQFGMKPSEFIKSKKV